MNTGRQPSRPGPSGSSTGITIPVLLAMVVLVPAIGLLWVWQFAEGRAAEPDPEPLTPAEQPTEPRAPAMQTNVLSWRRTPQLVANDAQLNALRGDVDEFVSTLADEACVDVWVGGERVAGHGTDAPLIPASSLKVVTSAAALEQLGADHRFTTRVHGHLGDDGVVRGDLVLVGGGDPLLFTDDYPMGIERHPVNHPSSLNELVGALADAGVTAVQGDVIGDGSRYDDEWYHSGWADSDLGVEAGPIGGLVVNRGRGADGSISAPTADPGALAAGELRRLLTARGVDVSGTARAGELSADGPEQIAQIDSAPLARIVEDVLTNSDNNASEMLIKELGATSGDHGNWASGTEAAIAQLEEWGVPTGEIAYRDGSGLSTDNRMTCRALATVLERFGYDSAVGSGLAVAGESGTLTTELGDSSVRGRLAAKTGSLASLPAEEPPPATKALVGFLPEGDGATITFALLLNGPTIHEPSEYQPVWGALADTLDTYPSGPSAAQLGP